MLFYSKKISNNHLDDFRNGFTIIELIMVITIISIIAAVAAPRFWNNDDMTARLFADDTLSALRYAQKLAIASGCHVQIAFTVNSYTLNQRTGTCTDTANAFSVAVEDPTFSPDTPIASNTLPASLNNLAFFTSVNGAAFAALGTPPVYYYDTIGQPIDSATDTLFRNTVLRVDIGAVPISIFVESITGFAHL